MLQNYRWRYGAILLTLVLPYRIEGQQADPGLLRLSKINVVGAAQYTREQVIAISGLKEGQTVRLADLGAAADRLAASGLFKGVTYRYAATGIDTQVTLEVIEDKFRIPVVLDNFIGFKDEDLIAAIRQDAAGFDGTSPVSTAALDAIKHALEALLQKQNVAAQVEYTSQSDMRGRGQIEVFSVKGAEFRVCAVEFQGVGPDRLSEIKARSKPLLKGLYSRAFITAFANGNLIPVYRSKGYLRAAFHDSQATMSSDCSRGVTVTLAVDEGPAYTWLKADWIGNKAIGSSQLDQTLQIHAGEVANGLKIDSGLAAIKEAYGRKGYIGLRIGSQPDYDDQERRVTFRFNVDEGPQYHMGKLVLTGLPERQAARIKGKWKLAEGDVFDESYFKDFVARELSGESLAGAKEFEVSSKPDRKSFTVDIAVVMTPARPN